MNSINLAFEPRLVSLPSTILGHLAPHGQSELGLGAVAKGPSTGLNVIRPTSFRSDESGQRQPSRPHRRLHGCDQIESSDGSDCWVVHHEDQRTNSAIKITMGIGMPSIKSKIERMFNMPP